MEEKIRIGVIGGTGVYQIDNMEDVQEVAIDTPFGTPSDNYLLGTLNGQRVAFLARHGRGHRVSPTRLNARANMYGFKSLGVEYVIAANACGSLCEEIEPSHIVIPDQFFDRTNGRKLSFFDDPTVGTGGIVAHMSMADPFCPFLSDICHQAAAQTGTTTHKGGAIVVIEGPRFSTKAESNAFRQLGMDIIGMTTVPEAQLAREAEMSYASIAHVTDYDVWHESEEAVTVEIVMKRLHENAGVAKQAIVNAIALLADADTTPQTDALKYSILPNDSVAQGTVKRFEHLLGKYF